VDDGAVACRSKVDHFADRRRVLVPGHDDGAGLDVPGVAGLVEKGPDVAGLVFVVESAVMSTRYISALLSRDYAWLLPRSSAWGAYVSHACRCA
jgi:hypothetical protein